MTFHFVSRFICLRILQVYDYDWGLRDDYIGQTLVNLKVLPLNTPQDLVLTLHDSGKLPWRNPFLKNTT